MFTTEDLEKNVRSIIAEGFTYQKEVMGFSWINVTQDRIERIGLGYRGYSGGFYLYTPHATIAFPEVENELNTLLDKYKIEQSYGDYTIQAQLTNVNGINFKMFDIEISNNEVFSDVAREVQKIINEGALPFFEKYKSLNSIADFLSDKRPEEIVPYIQGAILLPKSILILKLANHPNYRTKLIEFHQVLLQYAEKKEIYKLFLKIFNELFEEDLR